MSRQDNSLYVLPEDDEEVVDGEGMSENEDGDDKNGRQKPKSPKSPFRLMLEVLIGPIEGWKSLRRQKLKPQQVLSGLLYPMTGLAAASQFAELFYDANASMSNVVVKAVIEFISFFFGYYAIMLLLKLVTPSMEKECIDTDFCKEYVAVGLASLAFFAIFTTLLPMLEPVLVFLPLWTVYAMSRGVRFLGVSEEYITRMSILVCVLCIAVPYLFGWFFSLILPV